VSTVGELWPEAGRREIIAKTRGIVLEGRGDARDIDYMKKIGYDTIGCGRLYETMVFRAGEPCGADRCGGCGLPECIDGSSLDFVGYNKAADAAKGHLAMCKKWAAKRK
jgi:hypothetical protein